MLAFPPLELLLPGGESLISKIVYLKQCFAYTNADCLSGKNGKNNIATRAIYDVM